MIANAYRIILLSIVFQTVILGKEGEEDSPQEPEPFKCMPAFTKYFIPDSDISAEQKEMQSWSKSQSFNFALTDPTAASEYAKSTCPNSSESCCSDEQMQAGVRTYYNGISETTEIYESIGQVYSALEEVYVELKKEATETVISQSESTGEKLTASDLLESLETLLKNKEQTLLKFENFFKAIGEYYGSMVCEICRPQQFDRSVKTNIYKRIGPKIQLNAKTVLNTLKIVRYSRVLVEQHRDFYVMLMKLEEYAGKQLFDFKEIVTPYKKKGQKNSFHMISFENTYFQSMFFDKYSDSHSLDKDIEQLEKASTPEEQQLAYQNGYSNQLRTYSFSFYLYWFAVIMDFYQGAAFAIKEVFHKELATKFLQKEFVTKLKDKKNFDFDFGQKSEDNLGSPFVFMPITNQGGFTLISENIDQYYGLLLNPITRIII